MTDLARYLPLSRWAEEKEEGTFQENMEEIFLLTNTN